MNDEIRPIPDTFRGAVMSTLGLRNARTGEPVRHPKMPHKLFKSLSKQYATRRVRAVNQIMELLPPETSTLCSPFFRGPVEVACAASGIKVVAYRESEPDDNLHPLMDAAGIDHEQLQMERGDFREAIGQNGETFLYVAPHGLPVDAKLLAEYLQARNGWVLVTDDTGTLQTLYQGHYIIRSEWPRAGRVVLSRDFMAI